MQKQSLTRSLLSKNFPQQTPDWDLNAPLSIITDIDDVIHSTDTKYSL